MTVEERLSARGLSLPTPASAVATYVPYSISAGHIYVSGQLPMGPDGPVCRGCVGRDVSIDEAVDAAQLCGLNILAQLKAACGGDLARIDRIVRLGGFVHCIDGFTDQPKIINGASDLMVEAFGDRGRHARAAVGVNALPLGVPVEIDAIASFT